MHTKLVALEKKYDKIHDEIIRLLGKGVSETDWRVYSREQALATLEGQIDRIYASEPYGPNDIGLQPPADGDWHA